MGTPHPPSAAPERHSTARHPDLAVGEADALREENRQLRELVIQLSKLVIRNVVERGNGKHS